HEDGWKRNQRRFREKLAGDANAIALGNEVGWQPKQQSEIDHAEADGGKAEREELAKEGAPGERDGRAALERDLLGRTDLPGLGSEALHDLTRLFPPTSGEKEFGGFGDECPKQDQRKPGRKVEDPQDSPAEEWLEDRREGACCEIAADGTETT